MCEKLYRLVAWLFEKANILRKPEGIKMRYVYKDNIIESLQVLSDYNFQKQALLNPTGPYMWIYHEEYENIFEDTGLLEAWQDSEIVFNKEADQALRVLEEAMRKIDSHLPDLVIVDLPEMQIVRQIAAQALKLINEQQHS